MPTPVQVGGSHPPGLLSLLWRRIRGRPSRSWSVTPGLALSADEFSTSRAAAGYGSSVNRDALSAVPCSARRVLDVGCGTGATGRALKRRQYVEVHGVELDREQASAARSALDSAVCGDIERLALPFPAGHFDCIMYGDVLEHLVWPGDVLRSHRVLLSPSGVIVATVPNVRYAGVICRLALGVWGYSDCGILDSTHLRFFTLGSIVGLFAAAGLRVTSVRRSYGSRAVLGAIDRLTLGLLSGFLTYKYTVVAQPELGGADCAAPREATPTGG